jgi:hypothetical protein
MSQTSAPWQEHDPQELVVWRPVAPARTVEGPLALELFAGRTLALQLVEGQIACREQDDILVQVWLGGHHHLTVPGDPDLAARGRLWFVRDDVPLAWRWREGSELVVSGGADRPQRLPLRGQCALTVADGPRLHQALLRGLPVLDPDNLVGLLRIHVQAALEARLGRVLGHDPVDPWHAQVLLEDLAPDDLADELAPLGLRCAEIAATTPVTGEVAPRPDAAVPPGSYDDLL